MNFEKNGREILYIEEVITPTQKAIVKTFHCWATKLVMSGDLQGSINTPISLTVEYRDWQDNPLPDENHPINISVTGHGQPQNIVLTPTGGKAEFDFVSELAGTYTIRAFAEFPCDSTEMEVTVL